jgi:anti-anti-sigma regulatory factor
MDSSGIAILLRAAARVDSIEVRNPSSTVRRIIECTGLTEVLHLGS